jgi:hypothetical protein
LAAHAAHILLVEVRKADDATNQQEQDGELGVHKSASKYPSRFGDHYRIAITLPKLKIRQFEPLPAQHTAIYCVALYTIGGVSACEFSVSIRRLVDEQLKPVSLTFFDSGITAA